MNSPGKDTLGETHIGDSHFTSQYSNAGSPTSSLSDDGRLPTPIGIHIGARLSFCREISFGCGFDHGDPGVRVADSRRTVRVSAKSQAQDTLGGERSLVH